MSDDETPRILQVTPAPVGLYANYMSGWVPSKTPGYEVRERWSDRIDCLVLAEWADGERNVYPVTVTEEGVSWNWNAWSITTEPVDDDDQYESRKVREPS